MASPLTFIKKYSEFLAPKLLFIFQNALINGKLPESMSTSIITLIHKKGKDPQYFSLGNVDGKILAKVHAKRLENLSL